MHPRQLVIVFIAPLTSAAVSVSANAADVYTWVDQRGVTHYSQWLPDDARAPVSVIEIDTTNPPDYVPADDPYSIENQAKRINADWVAFAEARAAEKSARKEAQDDGPAGQHRDAGYIEPNRRYLSPFLLPVRPYRYFPKYGIQRRFPGQMHHGTRGAGRHGPEHREPPAAADRDMSPSPRPARSDVRWAPPRRTVVETQW